MKVVTEEILFALGDQRGMMSVRIWEPETVRANVFCVHGFSGNSADFEFLAPFLAGNGYRVICPDMIGRGKSAYFGDQKFYTLEAYLRTLGHLAQKYHSKTSHLIGNSWGAIIGLVFASVIRMKAGKIILNDPCLQSSGQLDSLRQKIVDLSEAAFDSLDDVVEYLHDAHQINRTFPRERLDEIARSKFRESKGSWKLAIDPAVIDGLKNHIGMEYDVYDHLGNLNVPALLLYGKSSPYYEPDRLDPLVARCQNLTCVSDLDGGHAIPMLTAHTALLVLGFLEAQQPGLD